MLVPDIPLISAVILRLTQPLTELTFIVLARPDSNHENEHEARYHHTDGQHHPASQLEATVTLPMLTPDEVSQLPMIGDVNLFFKGKPSEPEFEVEAEVMIAGTISALYISDPPQFFLPPLISHSPFMH